MPNWKKLIVSGSSAHLYNLNVANAVTASYFKGDGSGLTNVTTTVAELASVTDTFTNATSKVVTHNFDSKNVIVAVYSGDFQIIPSTIETTSNNTVTVTFETATTGHVVVSKGGHLLNGTVTAGTLGGYSGSYYLDYNNFTNIPQGIVSSSRQLETQISGSFNIVSASLASRISNISTDFVDIQNKPTLLSGSTQIASEISGSFTLVSASLASRISNISTDFADIENKPTLVSGSSQIDFNLVSNKPIGLISGSNQIASEISGSFTLVSASFASTIGNLDNIYATDTQLSNISASFVSTIGNLDNIYATDLQLAAVSESITTRITDLSTTNVVEGTNLYYTDTRVKSKLNSDGVISGSSQINVKDTQFYNTLATTGSNTFNGSQTVNGDVDINGKLTATSFGYIFVSSSVIYTSGSTKFGDSFDDNHRFTGSVLVDGGIKVQVGGIEAHFFSGSINYNNLKFLPTLLSGSAQIASEISGSFTLISSSLAQRITDLDNTYASDIEVANLSGSIANDITYIRSNFAFASNVNSISQSFAQTIDNLGNTYATDLELSNVSSSLASSIAGISTDFYDITSKPTLLSGSTQIASEISGSFTAVSASFANTISNLGSIYATDLELSNVSASFATVISNLDNNYATDLQLSNVSASLASTISNLDSNYATDIELLNVSASLADAISSISTDWPDITNKPVGIVSSSAQLYNTTLEGMIISGSFSGSYIGDGSGLTGVQTTVVQNATVTDNFTAATSKVISHNFGTKNVIVSVYDSNDAVIIPKSIVTTDTNTVTLGFDYATTGRVVVAKGGHIVSGSQLVDIVEVVTQADSFTSQTTYTATHNFGTKNVFVTVYDNNDNVIIPSVINTPTTSSVQLTFAESTTGRVVIGKAGHVITPESVNLTVFPYTGNAIITGSLSLTGQTELGGNLVPRTARGATLGTLERPFREIYLQSGSINIASDTPGAPNTSLSNIGGNILVSAGGMRLVGAASFIAATGSFDYISGSMTQVGDYNQTGDSNMTGNKTITGSLYVSSSVNITDKLYVNGNKQYNYGQFSDTTTQSGSADTAYAMKFNTTDLASGFSVIDGTKITAANTGVYNLQFSAQFEQTTNHAAEISIWIRKSGTNVPNSNTELTIEKINGGGKAVAAWNYMIELNATQYVELVWSSNRSDTQLHYHETQSTPTRPATPSIIATITQIT